MSHLPAEEVTAVLADRPDCSVPHQFTSQITDRGGTRFQSGQKPTVSSGGWAGGELGFLFLNSRWLLPRDLCHFSILPDIPSLLPISYILVQTVRFLGQGLSFSTYVRRVLV